MPAKKAVKKTARKATKKVAKKVAKKVVKKVVKAEPKERVSARGWGDIVEQTMKKPRSVADWAARQLSKNKIQ